jgi:hypothetical protein
MQDGTWSTITGGCTVVRDLKDMLFHSYFAFMDDLRHHEPPGGKPFEIRFVFFFLAISLLPRRLQVSVCYLFPYDMLICCSS